ncbi:MAG: tryptophan-rich sensory protein [Candidatus Nanoarchaeia archaeon]|nr:tryptophan-rich sensory protein [Candidatus Nanoarchaeia archaeon]
MKRVKIKVLILCFLVVYLIAFIGSLFTSSSVNSAWYESVRTSLTPPNWVFPVVWNILFFLIALSLYFAWTSKKSSKKTRLKIAVVFGINLGLNTLWSLLFFTLQNPVMAFCELILLWGSILAMIVVVYKVRKVSAYLLIPYAFWVAFAGILNYLIAFGKIY